VGTISKESAAEHIEMEGFEGHYGTIGDFTIGFETYSKDDDLAPMFAGLPDDACQAEHWGVVLEGKLIFKYTDGTEDVITAGQAYWAKPGHTPVLFANTRVVEFSPTEAFNKTLEVVEANMAAMQAG